MPCKVLRVEVEEGQEVKKDQPLVVIESMKMETVIRSPHDGVIAKVVHGKGVSTCYPLTNVDADCDVRICVKRGQRWWNLLRRRRRLDMRHGGRKHIDNE